MSASMSDSSQPSVRPGTPNWLRLVGALAFTAVCLLAISVAVFSLPNRAATAASSGGLTVTVLSAPNLVVDSNALAPSTYSPKVATVAGKFCNTNSYTLTNVMGYIGSYSTTASARTPGVYPVRYYSDTGFAAQYPWAHAGDAYSLTHIGGRLGLMDAARFIGDIPPNSCKYQYWSFSYPHTNPAHDSAVWGQTRLTNDDLSLRFDVWGQGATGVAADTNFTVTMRNEISAMANKIQPNPAGRWFNTDTSRVLPGQLITSNGVLYTFGTINQGFDADSNFVPDFDAWMQPIGDPSYDPSCFRLIKTSGVLTISRNAGSPALIYPFVDQLYFPNLPQDNTGGIGNVYYTFLALTGPCATALSPYQEVASGSENEKFNGDYGASVPPPGGYTPSVTITKGGTGYVQLGGLITYSINLNNQGSSAAGLPLINMPLVMSDSIPAGTTLQAGSIVSDTALTVLYSTDRGVSWSSTPPSPLSAVTNIQYWLNDSLAAGATAQVTFTVQMTTTPPVLPYVTNCADERFGTGTPFGSSCTTTYLQGPYQGGHYTWKDENLDQAKTFDEAYLPLISTTLYYDLNGNSILDTTDPVISRTATGPTGFYTFSNLYTGTYLVQVNDHDTDIPYGYRATTDITHVLTVSSTTPDYTLANFGFGPTLTMTKSLADPIFDNTYANYNLSVSNLRPGSGDQVGNYCRYTIWPAGLDAINTGTGNQTWSDPGNAVGAPDGKYALAGFANTSEELAVTGWNLTPQPGNVVSVEVILPIQISNNTAGTFNVSVLSTTNSTVISTAAYAVTSLSSGNLIVKNVAGPWTWADFRGSNRSILLQSVKSGSTRVNFKADAAGFYVYADRPCATPASDDIMTTVPLTDTFDSTKLTFVSSVPTYTSMSIGNPTGIITWDNIGPLAPGATKNVQVTFLVSDTTVVASLTNHACTIGTTFSDGGYASNGCATVTKNISPSGHISGVVWSDVNLNGWQGTTGFDTSDLRIPGVNVTLFACYNAATFQYVSATGSTTNKDCPAQSVGNTSWVTVTTQATDRTGGYNFTGLVNAWYAVVLDTSTIPQGYSVRAAPTGLANGAGVGGQNGTCTTAATCQTWANDHLNANLDPASYTPISSANAITQVNFGYSGAALIYGTIWQDYNADGLHQSSDTVLDNGSAGVTVTLYRAGSAISTTQTNANGYYVFPGLSANTYSVTVNTGSLPSDGGTWTQTAQGVDWGSPCTGCSGVQTVIISTGEIEGSYDFGYHRSGPVVLGDTVYYDWNGNGTQDANETGIPNVGLTLYRDSNPNGIYDSSDATVVTTTTTITGYYLFTGIPTRTAVITYFVAVNIAGPTFPQGVWQTGDPDEVGTCQVCNSIGRAEVLNNSILTLDFGYQPFGWAAIGDTVYRDLDGNGLQEGTLETGIPSVYVWLESDINGDGSYSRIMTATTSSTGYYLFSDLPGANYRVVVDSTSSALPTDGYGQKYIPSTAIIVTKTLASSETYLEADFGFMPLGAIGDTIYWDANGNAEQERAEVGIPGINVTLVNSTTLLVNGVTYAPGAYQMSQTTNATGTYLFTGLVTGTYTVTVGAIPGNPALTGDPDTNGVPCPSLHPGDLLYPYCDGLTTPQIMTGTIFLGADFGYQPSGVIGDFVFHDLNGDGLQNTGEPGIHSVVVTVTNSANGTSYTTTTDIDGRYSFSNLPVSSMWYVTFTQPANMVPTISSGTAVSNGIGSVGTTVTVTLNGSGSVVDIGGNACTNCSLHIDSGFKLSGSYHGQRPRLL